MSDTKNKTSESEIDEDDKINFAQNLIKSVEDEESWPHNPMVRVNVATGEMTVESDLNSYSITEVSLGQVSDLFDWLAIGQWKDANDTDWLELFKIVFVAAKEKFEGIWPILLHR